MKPVIVSETPVTSAQAKAILKAIEKRDTELSFRAGKTMEHLNNITTLTDKQAKSLYKELTDLNIPRLKDIHMVKMVDLMPATEEDVKGILSAYALTLKSENIKQIIEVLDKYRE